ncbi:MAG: hypothetical protein ACFFB2_12805 [Promethearchaeota archaeon]
MQTRENLSQLSENELEKLYQEKKEEFDQRLTKNRRIRGILSRKIDEKQKIVTSLNNEIEDFFASHPELNVVKQDFDDAIQDPEELNKLIQEKQQILFHLQSTKLNVEKSISEISNHIKEQKILENQYQQEISSLISHSDAISNFDESELSELDLISQEIQSAQDELQILTNEIEELRNLIHQQG